MFKTQRKKHLDTQKRENKMNSQAFCLIPIEDLMILH